jgi:branched-chain amino acid transport system substrate-binding protein
VQAGAELATVVDDGANLRVLPIVGRGSVQTLVDILKDVDLGIVHKDAVGYLERKGYASNIRNQLVYVARLFAEEMHVLAPRAIVSMQDLDGKTVAVDQPDGGAFVTAINVFERLGIRTHVLAVEPRAALDMLRRGDIDAIVAVEGKPLQWLAQITDTDLHLVPVDYARSMRHEYLAAQLSSADYPNLVARGEVVETIATDAILASYNWPPDTEHYRRLSNLVESFFSHSAQLQRPSFHPKWRELAPRATVTGWTRFRPAQEWLDRSGVSAAPAAAAAGSRVATPDSSRTLYRPFLEERAIGSAAAGTAEDRPLRR